MQPAPFRPADLRDLTQPPRTAAQVCAEAFANPPAPFAFRVAELSVKLRMAAPQADAADIDEAAHTLASMNLHSCLLDRYVGYRAKAVLQSYAGVILAHAAPAKAVAA